MRVLTVLPQDDLRKVGPAARAIEAAGYDGAMSMENQHEPFLPLAVAATATERVGLMTGIAIAFARSPMVVAEAAHDLQTASGGRFVLGLGTQVKGHNERRFSVPWSPPAPRLREYIEGMRAIWRCWEKGGKLDYRGKHYQFTLMTPNFTPKPNGLPPIPVTIAAVGPAMLRLAGRVCDGVRLHPFCTRKYIEEKVLPQLNEGLAESGLPRERFEITGGGYVVTGPDQESVDKMFEWVRYRVAFYGSTRSYFPVWEAHGLEDLGLKLHEMSKRGEWNKMAAEIPDDVARLFCAAGTHDTIVAEIEQRFGGVSDALNATLTTEVDPGLTRELIQDIQRLPQWFRAFRTDWALPLH
jgi:probable F420-dependent oxidoreductase